MKNFYIFLIGISFCGFAQIPNGYYSTINTQEGAALKTALYNIIKTKSVPSYDGLYTAFQTTDRKANGKVWDMYSDIPGGTPPYEYSYGSGNCGSYKDEGDCYNREHSFPQSWFNSASPMKSDVFHLYPTDGKVNGIRSNFPFGEVGSATTTTRNGSKLGGSKSPGYTGTVFEPLDEYKGDFARTYFYMATAYENLIGGWVNNGNAGNVLDGSSFPVYDVWFLNVLAKWHNQDPVSAKEIARNNAVYGVQNNRNPFIDNPQWAGKIWGFATSSSTGVNTTIGVNTSPGVNTTIGINTTTGPLFQTILAQDFAGCPTLQFGWQIVTITGLSWRCSTFGGGQMEANGRISATSTAPGGEGWLISPNLNLATATGTTILEFSNKSKFIDSGLPHPQMKVFYSTNYNGTNAATATWTPLDGVSLAGANTTTTTEMTANSSTTLTGFNQSSIYFGFKYNSSASNNNAVRWIVDNIIFKTEITPPPATLSGYELNIFNDPIELSPATNTALAMSFMATKLTGNPTLTAENGILISLNSATGFGSSIALTATNGSIGLTNIYVKVPNPFTTAVLNGNITISGGGLATEIKPISLIYADAPPVGTDINLFFSEYVEVTSGSSKFLEIYNPNTFAVDLATNGFKTARYGNGATALSDETLLTGTIAPGGVYLVTNANGVIAGINHNQLGLYFFNGNDAVVLLQNNTVVDIIGQKGFDPGVAWVGGSVSTANQTLRRKASVCTGRKNENDTFDPNLEWETVGVDVFSGLGSHTATCTTGFDSNQAIHPSINMYPNPAQNEVIFDGLLPHSNISFFDVLGNEVLKYSTKNSYETINLSNFKAGLYYISIDTELKSQKLKLVIVK